MAGPMVGPLLERLAARARPDLLGARRRVPRPRAQPAAAREPRASSSRRCAPRAPTSASPGTATPTAASSSTTRASSSTATSSPRCSPSRSCEAARAPTSSTTSAPRARSPTPSRPPAARALVNRVGHAFFKTRMRDEGGVFGGEVSGHYYFADFYNADSGTIPALLILELLAPEARDALRAARALPRALLHLGRDQLRGRRPGRRRSRELERRYADAESARARRHLGRLRGLALQRAPLQHRAAAAADASSRSSRAQDMEARRDEVLGLIRS